MKRSRRLEISPGRYPLRVVSCCSPDSPCVRCSMIRLTGHRFAIFHKKFDRLPEVNDELFFDETRTQPVRASQGEIRNQIFAAAEAVSCGKEMRAHVCQSHHRAVALPNCEQSEGRPRRRGDARTRRAKSRPPLASVVDGRSEPATGGRSGTLGLVGFRCRLSGIFEKRLHIVAAKAFYSPDRVTCQFASSDHPVDGHRRELEQIGELAHGVEFRLGFVFQLRSSHE